MHAKGSEIVQIRTRWHININVPKVMGVVDEATVEGLRDTVVETAADVVQGSPVLTGHNRRSIQYWARKLRGRIFSTSGYGGYLEVGTSKMPARPYFRPAADRHFKNLARNIARRLKVRGG